MSYGVDYTEAGFTLDEHYRYRYAAKELTQPVIAAIIANGWTYKPVYTFFRPLGG
ncbi:MAG: hypothetical protein AAF420_00750 [Pseudomonadota bacterium]